MKKLAVILAMCMVLAFAGFGYAQTCNVKEPGSMLVFPLVDNIFHSTIIDMANLGNAPVLLECYAITHGPPPAAEDDFLKIDFQIELTQRQPFYWDTSGPLNDGTNLAPSLADRKGFVFCWAIDAARNEIDWDFLKGEAILYDVTDQSAFGYNAYPYQVIAIDGAPRVLNLNGAEYCMATSRIYFEAFADGFAGLSSILALVNMDNNFPASQQPELDLGFQCWNQDEQFGSRNSHMQQFIQLALGPDLLLNQTGIGTDKYQCAVDATLTGQGAPIPIMGVLTGTIAGTGYEYGGLVWQEPRNPAATQVVLWPPVNP